MPLPMMSIKNEVKEEDDGDYNPPANIAPPPANCAFNKPQPTMNNMRGPGLAAQKFQPYPKMPPNAVQLNNTSANPNPYLNNNNAIKPPIANNNPMRTGVVAQKPNLPPAPLAKSFTAPLNNNNIISPSPIIGGQDEEEENYDFNALDHAENLRSSSSTALPPPVSSASF